MKCTISLIGRKRIFIILTFLRKCNNKCQYMYGIHLYRPSGNNIYVVRLSFHDERRISNYGVYGE